MAFIHSFTNENNNNANGKLAGGGGGTRLDFFEKEKSQFVLFCYFCTSL